MKRINDSFFKKIFNCSRALLGSVTAIPKKYSLLLLAISVGAVVGASLWPRTIQISFDQPMSCIYQPLLFAGAFESQGSEVFSVTPRSDSPIFSNQLCATAMSAPTSGDHSVVMSLFGLPIGKKIHVKVPKQPVASAESLSQPIPISKPLSISLDQPDQVFEYSMKIGEASADCKVKASLLECDITKLKLNQGSKYPASLDRLFAGKKQATLINREIITLSATSIKDTSIKQNETVYTKNKTIDVNFDKPVTKISAKLEKIGDDNSRSGVPVESTVNGASVQIAWPDDLERQKKYALTIDAIEAQDGSSLIESYVIPFVLSGGPKVTGVSIPKTRVPLGATAVITFDQPLLEKQDIAKAISVTGGAAITGVKGSQMQVSLAGVARCADFSIKISDTLQSNYEVTGGSAWSFSGRTICYSVDTIGYSSKGRAIQAYTFGSGPVSILYTGAIHGNEVSTRLLMLKWIDELEANVRSIPNDKTIVVVPAINPDGIADGTRVSGANVDLNRNFATSDWKKDITTVTNAPFPGGGGAAGLSEPESKAIAGLVGRLRPAIVLSYHSIGGLLQANMASNSNAKAAQYSSLSGYRNATGGTAFEYSITGTADDYYAERFGVGSIVIELGSHTYHQFERNQKAMWAMMQ